MRKKIMSLSVFGIGFVILDLTLGSWFLAHFNPITIAQTYPVPTLLITGSMAIAFIVIPSKILFGKKKTNEN